MDTNLLNSLLQNSDTGLLNLVSGFNLLDMILVVFVLTFLGKLLKTRPGIQNDRIPGWLALAGMLLWPMTFVPIIPDPLTLVVKRMIVGAFVGFSSVGLHQFFTRTFPVLKLFSASQEEGPAKDKTPNEKD